MSIKTKAKEKAKSHTVGLIFTVAGILFIILIVFMVIGISSSNNSKKVDLNNEPITETKLKDLVGSSSVTAFVEGGVIADEEHYSVEMTISSNYRNIRVLKGYQEVVENTDSLGNNRDAYEAFLKALDRASFGKNREDKSGFEYGEACPSSKQYKFSLSGSNDSNFNRWYSYCDSKRFGNYGGQVEKVYTLFREQFPEYSAYVKGVKF